jgi:hypothetical protein
VAGLLLVGCHHRKPAVSDADFKAFRASNPGLTQRCLHDYRYRGVEVAMEEADDPACYHMLLDQHWSGLWEIGWEWTNFCPDPAKQCDWEANRGIWLTFAKGAYRGQRPPDGVYRIDFIGRRTKAPGNFGHLGAYDHMMVVDRLISIRKIPGQKYTKRF